MDKINTYGQQLLALAVLYLPRLAMALALLVVGWWGIGWASRVLTTATARLDMSLRTFLTSMVSITLKVLLLISVAGMVGFETTSFVAILGAAGLAVGLALQGTLANFAGGVLILIFKPFTVGDTIESQGRTGVVKEILIFNTVLTSVLGDTIILPNGATSNGVIVNKLVDSKVLIEVLADVAAGTDIAALRAAAVPLLLRDEAVLREPEPQVVVLTLKPGAVGLAFRAYTLPGQQLVVQPRLTEALQQLLIPLLPVA